jgi:predicted outer membrane protein
MTVTYYVALPFIRTEDGVAAGEAQEMPNEGAAIRRAEAMSRMPVNAGALAFKRSGDPNIGSFAEATILKTFGDVPANLDEL